MAFNLESIIGGSIGDAFAKIAGVFKASPEAQLTAATELEKIRLGLEQQLVQQITAQIEVDRVEAANTSMFVAGWRPAIGWCCGLGLFVQFIVNPLATWIAALMHHPIMFPTLDLGTLMTLLLGMLGLGGMRTYEKINAAPGADKLK